MVFKVMVFKMTVFKVSASISASLLEACSGTIWTTNGTLASQAAIPITGADGDDHLNR